MSSSYTALQANAPTLAGLRQISALPPFSTAALDFVDALSVSLLQDKQMRAHPELIALAYWMRKANLTRLRDTSKAEQGQRIFVARGTVFHIAPANVDSISMYSWLLSLLCGNRNIVRLSSRITAQSEALVAHLKALFSREEYRSIAQRNLLISYPADDAMTAELSSNCDMRVLWGGDDTVVHLRSIPLPPHAVELTFSNKYSVAVISAEAWLSASPQEQTEIARSFWNDAYWFGQMACSSPRTVVWIGKADTCRQAAEQFWPMIDEVLQAKSEIPVLSGADFVNKLVAADSAAMASEVKIRRGSDNRLLRVWFDAAGAAFDSSIMRQHCGAGLFYECSLGSLDALRPLLARVVQTLSYWGWTQSQMRQFIQQEPLAGLDRIVPFGRALDFGLVWDGNDLIRAFMREISLL
jgi:hypothetical protein